MTVRLVSSREFLFCFAWAEPEKHVKTTLTEDMLQLPIYSGRGCDIEVSPSYRDAIRAALRGLMSLEDFDAVVSIEYFRFRKCLIVDDHTWGEISIKHQPTEIVASFKNYDPDCRPEIKGKRPFVSIMQWLQDPETNTEDKRKLALFQQKWHSPLKWRDFYLARIRKEVSDLERLLKENIKLCVSFRNRLEILKQML